MLLAMIDIAFALNSGGSQHTLIPHRFFRYLARFTVQSTPMRSVHAIWT